MTILEQFNSDVAYNANNIMFTMTDDEEMGQRGRGCYIKDIYEIGRECCNIIFDNGHHYIIDNEVGDVRACGSFPEEYFIHKHLEKIVSEFINKWSIEISFFYCLENEIEPRSLINLLPYREEKVVYLTNITIPFELKHKGLGKLLIKQVFEICQRLKYRLILLDVVDSFCQSLKKRNAKFINSNKIEITRKTILS